MRLHTAPGLYDPKTSDFDNAKFKVLKQKKITSRSDWAHRISFDSTETRFNEADKKVVPPPGSYKPKNEFSDLLKKANSRTGAFGSNTKRFEAAKPVYMEPDASGAMMEGFSDMMGGMIDNNFRGYSLTHSLTCLLTHSPAYSLTHSFYSDEVPKVFALLSIVQYLLVKMIDLKSPKRSTVHTQVRIESKYHGKKVVRSWFHR